VSQLPWVSIVVRGSTGRLEATLWSLSAQTRHAHFRELVTRGQASFVEDFSSAPIHIEDDVWIGFNSTILKGTHIGRGAIIGACALVTRDVEAFSIVAGNPAVVVGQAKP